MQKEKLVHLVYAGLPWSSSSLRGEGVDKPSIHNAMAIKNAQRVYYMNCIIHIKNRLLEFGLFLVIIKKWYNSKQNIHLKQG